ncbi:MAG: HNH endonuclease [Methylotenera sp.]|nr:MAG: HNH endonuclease [Methylotenera sp.]
MKHRYTREQLEEAILNSSSIRQSLQYLGIACQGGNYKVIHKAIKDWNIDASHFTGQSHNKGKKLIPKRDVSEYLNNIQPIGSHRLKKRLLADKLLLPICSHCGLDVWLNQPIPLELDHIDGNSNNNNITNLRLLCPNCHALTPNYRGKNKGAYSQI